MYFGKYIKTKRLSLDISLRNFCEQTKLDPSNWSKIERGRLKPTLSKKQFTRIFVALRMISKPSATLLKSLYLLDNIFGKVKPLTEQDILNTLPVLVRLTANQKAELVGLLEANQRGEK